MKPLSHEKKLAHALEQAIRELEHAKSHGFRCLAMNVAIEYGRKALKEYLDA